MEILTQEFLGLFIFISGFVIGLGAVTVIDLHGFLGRNSGYWTRATTTAHKVTKPLIWIGTLLAIFGGVLFYSSVERVWTSYVHTILAVLLVLNGLFLTFVVSPYLLKQERNGLSEKLLPKQMQRKITASFLVSILGWWGSLALLVYYLVFIYG